MKILILSSSFRKTGNTHRITNLLSRSIQREATRWNVTPEIRSINLSELDLTYCHGCRVCFDRGETFCPYWKEIAPVKDALEDADFWIMSSPVYVEDVSGVMKVFLERMAHVNHRPEFAGKYAFLVTTSGSGSSGHAGRTMASTLRAWGVKVIGLKDFVAGSLSSEEELAGKYQETLNKIADKIVDTYQKRKEYKPSFISLIFFAVQQKLWQRNTQNNLDSHYWESKGWLEPGVTFYIPHNTNPMILLFARLAGSLIALFFE